ncbi:MAG: TonB-dependent receptor [Gallionellaceae bacterium]|nr:TonB-dependent receptor [Gallionellaceae bacterium]
MFTSRFDHSKFIIVIFLALTAQHVCAESVDLTDLSLEQLLTVEVSSASKYSQRSGDAPSAVQIISRENIQLHGWRTLSEALVSLPGIYINNDRVYDFLGARGFQIPGDYNTRFLLLIDGQRNNDNIYQQAVIGTEGWLDMAMVERIEYIPGPGSAIYGSNAMFGVINVITRSADKKSAQSQVGVYTSKLGLTGVNAMTSQTLASNNTGLVLQYSGEHQTGHDRTYADPAGQLYRADNTLATDGVAHGLDSGNNHHLSVRVDHQEWSFKLINHERTVIPSSAPYLTVFDDPSMQVHDGGTQLTASVQHELSSSSSLFARLGYTDWHYRATYPYLDTIAGYYHNYDDSQGRTLDGEFRYQLHSGDHHLLTGMEFSRDLLARQRNFNSMPISGTADVNINPLVNRTGLFIQDEWRLANTWLLSLGLRQDNATASNSSHSPRLGVIWQPNAAWTAKLLAGRAYRSPNAYESQFGNGLNYLSNPSLQPETIRTTEGVLEWLSQEQMRWQLSLYDNQLNNLIKQVDTGGSVLQFQNSGWVRVRGAELGVEKISAANLKVRASLSVNHATNAAGTTQDNSPRWIGKASASTPVGDHAAYLAAEVQIISSRTYTWGGAPYRVGSEVLANTTLTFPNLGARGWQAQLRITNLFDRNVQHPASDEMPTPTVPQNRRNVMAQLDYAF